MGCAESREEAASTRVDSNLSAKLLLLRDVHPSRVSVPSPRSRAPSDDDSDAGEGSASYGSDNEDASLDKEHESVDAGSGDADDDGAGHPKGKTSRPNSAGGSRRGSVSSRAHGAVPVELKLHVISAAIAPAFLPPPPPSPRSGGVASPRSSSVEPAGLGLTLHLGTSTFSCPDGPASLSAQACIPALSAPAQVTGIAAASVAPAPLLPAPVFTRTLTAAAAAAGTTNERLLPLPPAPVPMPLGPGGQGQWQVAAVGATAVWLVSSADLISAGEGGPQPVLWVDASTSPLVPHTAAAAVASAHSRKGAGLRGVLTLPSLASLIAAHGGAGEGTGQVWLPLFPSSPAPAPTPVGWVLLSASLTPRRGPSGDFALALLRLRLLPPGGALIRSSDGDESRWLGAVRASIALTGSHSTEAGRRHRPSSKEAGPVVSSVAWTQPYPLPALSAHHTDATFSGGGTFPPAPELAPGPLASSTLAFSREHSVFHTTGAAVAARITVWVHLPPPSAEKEGKRVLLGHAVLPLPTSSHDAGDGSNAARVQWLPVTRRVRVDDTHEDTVPTAATLDSDDCGPSSSDCGQWREVVTCQLALSSELRTPLAEADATTLSLLDCPPAAAGVLDRARARAALAEASRDADAAAASAALAASLAAEGGEETPLAGLSLSTTTGACAVAEALAVAALAPLHPSSSSSSSSQTAPALPLGAASWAHSLPTPASRLLALRLAALTLSLPSFPCPELVPAADSCLAALDALPPARFGSLCAVGEALLDRGAPYAETVGFFWLAARALGARAREGVLAARESGTRRMREAGLGGACGEPGPDCETVVAAEWTRALSQPLCAVAPAHSHPDELAEPWAQPTVLPPVLRCLIAAAPDALVIPTLAPLEPTWLCPSQSTSAAAATGANSNEGARRPPPLLPLRLSESSLYCPSSSDPHSHAHTQGPLDPEALFLANAAAAAATLVAEVHATGVGGPPHVGEAESQAASLVAYCASPYSVEGCGAVQRVVVAAVRALALSALFWRPPALAHAAIPAAAAALALSAAAAVSAARSRACLLGASIAARSPVLTRLLALSCALPGPQRALHSRGAGAGGDAHSAERPPRWAVEMILGELIGTVVPAAGARVAPLPGDTPSSTASSSSASSSSSSVTVEGIVAGSVASPLLSQPWRVGGVAAAAASLSTLSSSSLLSSSHPSATARARLTLTRACCLRLSEHLSPGSPLPYRLVRRLAAHPAGGLTFVGPWRGGVGVEATATAVSALEAARAWLLKAVRGVAKGIEDEEVEEKGETGKLVGTSLSGSKYGYDSPLVTSLPSPPTPTIAAATTTSITTNSSAGGTWASSCAEGQSPWSLTGGVCSPAAAFLWHHIVDPRWLSDTISAAAAELSLPACVPSGGESVAGALAGGYAGGAMTVGELEVSLCELVACPGGVAPRVLTAGQRDVVLGTRLI